MKRFKRMLRNVQAHPSESVLAQQLSIASLYSQEVVWSWFFCWDSSHLLGCSLEDFVKLGQIFIEFEDRSNVSASIAIVRSGPHSHKSIVKH